MNPASPSARAIVIGAASSKQLSMHVTRREFPEASDYWDGNWVYTTIRIRAGAFRGEYEALLRTNELASFRDQPGVGNTLRFDLTLDQTELPPVLTALNDIVRAFPVKGSP